MISLFVTCFVFSFIGVCWATKGSKIPMQDVVFLSFVVSIVVTIIVTTGDFMLGLLV